MAKCPKCKKKVKVGHQYVEYRSDDRSIAKQGKVHLKCLLAPPDQSNNSLAGLNQR